MIDYGYDADQPHPHIGLEWPCGLCGLSEISPIHQGPYYVRPRPAPTWANEPATIWAFKVQRHFRKE